jgi:hypothetical protein
MRNPLSLVGAAAALSLLGALGAAPALAGRPPPPPACNPSGTPGTVGIKITLGDCYVTTPNALGNSGQVVGNYSNATAGTSGAFYTGSNASSPTIISQSALTFAANVNELGGRQSGLRGGACGS